MNCFTADPWLVEDPWTAAARCRFPNSSFATDKPPTTEKANNSTWSATSEPSDAALLSHAIMKGLADGGASRQAIAAAASAILRTHHSLGHGQNSAICSQLTMAEKIKGVTEASYGRAVSISQVCKDLKVNGKFELAQAVATQHQCRNLVAHPVLDLDKRLDEALISMTLAAPGPEGDATTHFDIGDSVNGKEIDSYTGLKDFYDQAGARDVEALILVDAPHIASEIVVHTPCDSSDETDGSRQMQSFKVVPSVEDLAEVTNALREGLESLAAEVADLRRSPSMSAPDFDIKTEFRKLSDTVLAQVCAHSEMTAKTLCAVTQSAFAPLDALVQRRSDGIQTQLDDLVARLDAHEESHEMYMEKMTPSISQEMNCSQFLVAALAIRTTSPHRPEGRVRSPLRSRDDEVAWHVDWMIDTWYPAAWHEDSMEEEFLEEWNDFQNDFLIGSDSEPTAR